MIFRLTASQRRRRTIGLAGGAAIVWVLGLVRLVTTDRLPTGDGLVPLVVLAVVLAGGVLLIDGMAPVVVLADDAMLGRRGPWRSTIRRLDITDIARRDRGVARRVVVHHGSRRTVLPVPLTGGSILGPGIDPELDRKVELLRAWWLGAEAP